MKVIDGFITNSSSSVFIVAFPKQPDNAADVQQMMFKNQTFWPHPYPEYYEGADGLYGVVASELIAQVVYNDIASQTPNKSDDEIIAQIERGSFPGEPDHEWEKTRDLEIDAAQQHWIQLDKKIHAAASKLFKEFRAKNPNSVIYAFEYEDHGDLGVMLEHGDIFHFLPHIRSSCH